MRDEVQHALVQDARNGARVLHAGVVAALEDSRVNCIAAFPLSRSAAQLSDSTRRTALRPPFG